MSTEYLQFKLAMMDTAFAKLIPKLNPMYDIPEGNEDLSSFFFPYYQQYFNYEGLSIEPIEDESKLPLQFRTYDHPAWNNWDEIWKTPPIELDTNIIPNPEVEFLFQSSRYRLQLDSSYFKNKRYCTIRQGTTITFKGYDHQDVRFVVECLQWIHEHNAHLKVTAITSNKICLPYNDPDYPSFILIVPLCLTLVPTPTSELELFYSLPLDMDDEVNRDAEDVEYCQACKNFF